MRAFLLLAGLLLAGLSMAPAQAQNGRNVWFDGGCLLSDNWVETNTTLSGEQGPRRGTASYRRYENRPIAWWCLPI